MKPEWTITIQDRRHVTATSRSVPELLERLQPEWSPSFAVLELSGTETYYQTAGGGGGMLLERRLDGRHCRGYQDVPVVPFEDGVQLCFAGSRIPLRRDEWFTRDQVVQCWQGLVEGRGEPAWLRWRDITESLEPPATGVHAAQARRGS
jgi:hypothetical protein